MIVLNTINTEPPFGLFKDHEGGIVNRVYSQLTVRDMPWCSEVARHPDAVFLKNTKEVFDFYEAINPSLQLEATFEPVFYDY